MSTGVAAPEISYLQFSGTEATQHSIPERQPPLFSSLDDVASELDRVFGASIPPSADDMVRIAAELSTTELLTRLINEVRGDQKKLQAIAQQSEKHPLGFYKILLLSTPQYQLRLNIWPAARGGEVLGGVEDVHNHRFDFVSCLLTGSLATWIYELPATAPPHYHTIPIAWAAMEDDPIEAQRALDWYYRQLDEHESQSRVLYQTDPTISRTHESLRLLGPTYTRLIRHIIQAPGSIYWLGNTTFHQAGAVYSNKMTATLFLRGPQHDTPDTFARMSSKPLDSAERPKERLSKKEVAHALTALLAELR